MVIALIAAALGFGGVAGAATGIAKLLCVSRAPTGLPRHACVAGQSALASHRVRLSEGVFLPTGRSGALERKRAKGDVAWVDLPFSSAHKKPIYALEVCLQACSRLPSIALTRAWNLRPTNSFARAWSGS